MHCRRAPNTVENQVRPIIVKMTEKLRLVKRLLVSRLGPMPPHRTQPATVNLLHGLLSPARAVRRTAPAGGSSPRTGSHAGPPRPLHRPRLGRQAGSARLGLQLDCLGSVNYFKPRAKPGYFVSFNI